ncbi:hypothetical protein ACHAQJ_006381 [Trichoderma viride]
MSQRPSRRNDFEIAIICALPLEYDAIALLVDEFWDKDGDTFGRAAGDFNTYRTGRIGRHDVVLALLSHMGKANASAAAASMRSSYTALRIVILAGICGGVPFNGQAEMLLGDVVISKYIVQYDFGRKYPNGFIRKGAVEDNLSKQDKNIRNLLATFNTDSVHNQLQERTAYFLQQLQEKAVKYQTKYGYPGISRDKLFMASYRHKHRTRATCICSDCHRRLDPVCLEAINSSCHSLGCDERYLVRRKRLEEQDGKEEAQRPVVHVGVIASGDTVMKSGEDRDAVAKQEGVIAFEMEGAGIWEELPCIVVKGICDYADCHKNKEWQNFAAATAASASKAILEQYIQTDRDRGQFIKESPRSHFIVPFGRNESFVGRERMLSELLKRIPPVTNKDDCQRTIIEGLGGVGKTQIALEAVYQVHNKYPDCSIFWVPVVNAGSFENAYRDIGKQLNITGIDEDSADVKQLVKTALSGESCGSWLMVIDNADDVELLFGATEISAHLPFSRKGSILFTTRNHEIGGKLNILPSSIICVAEMDEEEAFSLLRKGLTESQASDAKAIKRLLEFLANLPLAIRQASAYMAAKYLQFISFLAEKDIPKSLLPEAKKIEAMDAIGTLKAYAFITEHEGKDSFDMHRLVRLATQNWLENRGELKTCIISTIRRLDQKFPVPENENRDIWVEYLPHAQAALKFQKGPIDDDAQACLSEHVALASYLLGQYQVAELEYRRLLQAKEKVLGKDHLNTLISKDDLASTLYRQGRYNEAEQIYQEALKLCEKVLGKDHPQTLTNKNNLAIVLTEFGRYKEAEQMHQQTLKLSRYKEAEQMHQQTFKLYEKVLGKNHPQTLVSMANLAVILSKVGKNEEAEQLHRQTSKLCEKVLGKDHPDTRAYRHYETSLCGRKDVGV